MKHYTIKKMWLAIALAALLPLVSCTKDENLPSPEYARIVTAGFDEQVSTKTYRDNTVTKWSAGDVLWISDGAQAGTYTLVQSDISQDGTTTKIRVPSGITGKVLYMVYPASVVKNPASATATPTIVLPSDNVDGSFAKANIAAGKESGGKITLRNVGAIMKFTEVDGAIGSIDIMLPNCAGESTLTIEDTGVAASAGSAGTISCPVAGKSISETSPFYIAILPTVSGSDGKIAHYKNASGGVVGFKASTPGRKFVRNKVYNLGQAKLSGSIVSGVFSVTSTRKVMFAKGNLYYTSSGTWSMEANQYDFRSCYNSDASTGCISCIGGKLNENGGTPQGNFGLFYWNTTWNGGVSVAYVAEATRSASDIFFGTSIVHGYTVLSSDEWDYLLCGRNASTVEGVSNARYLRCRLNIPYDDAGEQRNSIIAGILLLPDVFQSPVTDESLKSLMRQQINNSTEIYADKLPEFSSSNFALLESAGAVFLPITGTRTGSGTSTSAASTSTEGRYCSSNAFSDTKGYYFGFTVWGADEGTVSIVPKLQASRSTGAAIRLVTTVVK